MEIGIEQVYELFRPPGSAGEFPGDVEYNVA